MLSNDTQRRECAVMGGSGFPVYDQCDPQAASAGVAVSIGMLPLVFVIMSGKGGGDEDTDLCCWRLLSWMVISWMMS